MFNPDIGMIETSPANGGAFSLKGKGMLQKFKEFINAKNEQIQGLGNPSPTPVQKTAEMIIIEEYAAYIQALTQNENVPKKVFEHMNSILTLVKQINFDDMTLDNQSLVRRIISIDVRQLMEVYLSLPKAHAVSVILENGKTAKQTVADNVLNLYNKINHICTETIEQKTELLLKKQKIAELKEKRKDFFDL
jgi:hypothetical protein